MAWLGWAQILRCSQDDQVRGRALTKPVEGSKDLVRQLGDSLRSLLGFETCIRYDSEDLHSLQLGTNNQYGFIPEVGSVPERVRASPLTLVKGEEEVGECHLIILLSPDNHLHCSPGSVA